MATRKIPKARYYASLSRLLLNPPLAISVSGHSSIREDAGPTEITLTATLAEATPADGTVQFELVPSSAGTPAVRGVDYEVRLPSDKTITIPAGETKGTRTITLNPLDNAKMDGRRSLSVRVTALGDSAQTDITITDDETPSTSIVLSVRPHTINEQDGRTSVEVTATLDGQALTEDTTVPLSVDYLGSTATSGADYAAVFNPDASLVILSGSITGSRQFVVVPVVDTLAEGDETIRLIGVVDGLEGAAVDLTLSDPAAEPTVSADPDSSGSSTAAPALEYTVGVAITPLVLAEVEGGTGERSYGVSDLPAGLTFDAATRTIAGTPTAVTDGPVTVTVTVTDEAGGGHYGVFLHHSQSPVVGFVLALCRRGRESRVHGWRGHSPARAADSYGRHWRAKLQCLGLAGGSDV